MRHPLVFLTIASIMALTVVILVLTSFAPKVDSLKVTYLFHAKLGSLQEKIMKEAMRKAAEDPKYRSLVDDLNMMGPGEYEESKLYTLEYLNGMSRYAFESHLRSPGDDDLLLNRDNTLIYKNHHQGEIVLYDGVLAPGIACKFPMLQSEDWNINKARDTVILGYPCLKAELMNEPEVPVTAWFAPSMEIPEGPAHYSGLAGPILALTVGKVSYVAQQVHVDEGGQRNCGTGI